MPTFSPEDILNSDISGGNETQYIPIPAGEYEATVQKVTVRTNVGAERDATVLDVQWKINDPHVREVTGMDSPTARQSVWLEIDNGVISQAKGKNVQLGRLRDAVGQNEKNKNWNPNMLVGHSALIAIEHTADRNDPEKIYANVRRVTAL